MKFILDENMPLSTKKLLEKQGHRAQHIRETSLRGEKDRSIAVYAKEQGAILITKDIEFGSILMYPKGSHHGLLIIRLPYFFTGNQITQTIREFLKTIPPETLINKRTTLELGRYRIRTPA